MEHELEEVERDYIEFRKEMGEEWTVKKKMESGIIKIGISFQSNTPQLAAGMETSPRTVS